MRPRPTCILKDRRCASIKANYNMWRMRRAEPSPLLNMVRRTCRKGSENRSMRRLAACIFGINDRHAREGQLRPGGHIVELSDISEKLNALNHGPCSVGASKLRLYLTHAIVA